jgi:hypothetical protein
MRECKGVVWGFSWLGATCWRFCRKTQKEPAKCLYSIMYTVYSVLLSPLWLKSVPGWPAISVSTFQQSRVGQIVWFGSLSAISHLASRGGGMGSWASLCLHSVTQPYTTCPRWREQGGGLRSLPLVQVGTGTTGSNLGGLFFELHRLRWNSLLSVISPKNLG